MLSRTRLADWLASPLVTNFVIGVILLNAVTLGLETSDTVMAAAGPLILAIDRICLSIFVIEIVLKLVAQSTRFFRSPWNLFDFVIVGIALVPNAQGMSVLRANCSARHFRNGSARWAAAGIPCSRS